MKASTDPSAGRSSFFRHVGLACLATTLALLAANQVWAAPPSDPVGMVHVPSGAPDFVLDFGTVQIGFVRTIGLGYSNIGGGDIANIVVGELQGDDPDEFEIVQDNCTGVTLAPGGSCSIFVSFEPPAMTDYSAEFTLTSSAPASPERILLLGAGVFDEIFHDRFQSSIPSLDLESGQSMVRDSR